jgi:hypothetical protein
MAGRLFSPRHNGLMAKRFRLSYAAVGLALLKRLKARGRDARFY